MLKDSHKSVCQQLIWNYKTHSKSLNYFRSVTFVEHIHRFLNDPACLAWNPSQCFLGLLSLDAVSAYLTQEKILHLRFTALVERWEAGLVASSKRSAFLSLDSPPGHRCSLTRRGRGRLRQTWKPSRFSLVYTSNHPSADYSDLKIWIMCIHQLLWPTCTVHEKLGHNKCINLFVFQNAIANASSLAEVERLKGMLQAGQIPGRELQQGQCQKNTVLW